MSFSGELAGASLEVLGRMHQGWFDAPEARVVRPLVELQERW